MCGATGLNAVERFLIGSVSEHIIRYAKCDVLVVRGDEEQGELLIYKINRVDKRLPLIYPIFIYTLRIL